MDNFKGLTLYQLIGELQKLAVEHGNDEISSIGASSGKLLGLTDPYCFHFREHDGAVFVPRYQEDVKDVPVVALDHDGDMRTLWMRVGMSLDVTVGEAEVLLSENGDVVAGAEIIMKAVQEGRGTLDGDTYVPEDCVRDFNEEYGTDYKPNDYGWELYAPLKENKVIDGLIDNAISRTGGERDRHDEIGMEISD